MKILYILLLIFIQFTVKSQEITIENRMNPSKFEEVLQNFEGYKFYHFNFNSDTDINFEITEKEFVNGILINESVFLNSNSIPESIIQNKKSVSTAVLARSTSDKNYKMNLQLFDFVNRHRNFDLKKEENYYFKIFINVDQKMVCNKTYLFFGIVKPIKINENTYRDCDFALAIDKYDKWFDIFGLERYFTYEIKFY